MMAQEIPAEMGANAIFKPIADLSDKEGTECALPGLWAYRE